ncbi:MAG: TlpA family protein disulfide reductase [Myxococcales bacterium]|nr:TlpA family protein disulfide reductase [Myxococcales bacterium]
MDRLSALIIGALALTACDKHEATDGDPPSRTNGAKVTKKAVNTEAFCDVHFTGDQGPLMAVPEVAGKEAIVPAAGGWHWFNVWATWCKPCVDELPRLLKWRDKLRGAGKKLEVSFISVDETDADVAEFRKEHAGAPASARLIATKDQGAWFQQMGLDGNPPIPIHVFVAPSGHIRCARAGSVREQDYAAIEALLAE